MKTSNFQVIFIGFLILSAVIGVIFFSLARNESGSVESATVTLWGTLPRATLDTLFQRMGERDGKPAPIVYVQKNPSTLDQDFLEALADGTPPDLILVSQDSILKYKDKLFTVPFTSYSERQFRDTFVNEGELFLSRQGISAFPFLIDPLVLYWNRDIYTNAEIALPPPTWKALTDMLPKLREKNNAGTLTRSPIALGEYKNVLHAKEILSALFLQSGNPIVSFDSEARPHSVLGQTRSIASPAPESVLAFYLQFADPTGQFYSWNRSLPLSRDQFVAGKLANYIGFASEYDTIATKNVNLNFDVALLPQVGGVSLKTTFATVEGISIVKNSKNIADSLQMIGKILAVPVITDLAEISGLPPVRKDLLATPPGDLTSPLFYKSALMSRAWLDPSPLETNTIFKTLVEKTLAGGGGGENISRASSEIEALFK